MSGGMIVPANWETSAKVDLVEDIKQQMRDRLEMLQQYKDEYEQITEALNRLTWEERLPSRGGVRWGRGMGRPAGSGSRQAAVLDLLRGKPGLTAKEVNQALGYEGTGAGDVLKNLERLGSARRERGNKKAARWYLVEQAS